MASPRTDGRSRRPVSPWVLQFGSFHPTDPGKGLDTEAPPMISIDDMFDTMFRKAMQAKRPHFDKFVTEEPTCLTLNVATVCSGTEAPLTALKFIKEASRRQFGKDILDFRHQFSCEIEPYKQAFIRRNHDPPLIFRNVVELGAKDARKAMDASGCEKDIPTDKLDMLIAGTSCVDFSALNNKKGEKTKVNAFSHYQRADLTGEESSEIAVDEQFRAAVHEQLSPEGLKDLGESMTTFLSTLNFIMDRRPRIVILENVQTAPWKAMQNFWLPRAGYTASFLKVNSKDFYVPQERLRGYLVAFDVQEFGNPESGLDAEEVAGLAEEVNSTVGSLKQRASSSVLDFLLDDDEPAVLQGRDELTRYGANGVPVEGKPSGGGKQVDWDFNQIRHSVYAQRWNLDTVRHFSEATLSHGRVVSISPPANSWIGYWSRETPRVIDLFDNLYQLMLKRAGCDMNYKAAMFNISQSLDRMVVSIVKFGIAPIITPTGMPTLTMGARPLLGIECLALQGIPKNHLRLAGETHKELRDLAGNAMTVTAVGAVLIAAILAVHPQLERLHPELSKFEDSSVPMVAPQELALILSPDWDFGNFSLDLARLKAYGPFKVCQCPVVGSHKRTTFCCRQCGKLACQLCKDNPPHDLEQLDHASLYHSYFDLKVHLQQGLPGVFSMNLKESSVGFFRSMRARSVNPLYRAAAKSLLSSDSFYFCGVKVATGSVVAEYRSEQIIARLTLTTHGSAEWYIFASRSEALGTSRIGFQDRRDRPIARGSVGEESTTVDPGNALWFIWEHVRHTWEVTVMTKNENDFNLSPWKMESMSSPPELLEEHVRRMIRGSWYAKPKCGTAEGSLYIRTDGTGRKTFLFKDVNPIGHPARDRFIFTTDIELAQAQNYRGDEVVLHVLQIADLDRSVEISVPGYWQPVPSGACFETSPHVPKAEAGDELLSASCQTLVEADDPPRESCCTSPPLALFKLTVNLAGFPVPQTAKEKWGYTWYDVPPTERDEFFRAMLFATNGLRKGQLFKLDLHSSIETGNGFPVRVCTTCCLKPPQVYWVMGPNKLVPWEDPKEISDYEAKLKAMPPPFTARIRLDPDKSLLKNPAEANEYESSGGVGPPPAFQMDNRLGPDGMWDDPHIRQHDLRVVLAGNPRTLASRAAAHLVYDCRPERYSSTVLHNVKCFYQVEVGALLGPDIRFDRFYDSIPTTEDTTGVGAPGPSAAVGPDLFKNTEHKLSATQISSVNWMLAREECPDPYPETESEEQVFEDFNMRIVGRAIYQNDGSDFLCRGGIVAHQIGYGKTVVTIALLKLRHEFDMRESIGRRREDEMSFWQLKDSFIHLKATLVIVPQHITTQWKDEFGKFGWPVDKRRPVKKRRPVDEKIVVINRHADLLKKKVSELENADVIIVPTGLFTHKDYISGLANLAGNRSKGGKSVREVEDRYQTSLKTIRKVVAKYSSFPNDFTDATKQQLANQEAEDVLAEINGEYEDLCSRWVWAGGRKESNKKQRQGIKVSDGAEDGEEEEEEEEEGTEEEAPMASKGKGKGKRAKKGREPWTPVTFLENFSFARIIVDEFSYDNTQAGLFFANSLANAKWLLSGTPRCGNLADIVHLGRLLSVHVARPDPCVPTYLDPITIGPHSKPYAPSEEYRLRAAHARSHNFALDRHRVAQNFIQHFMRQDKVDPYKFPCETTKIEVKLDTLAQVAYGGLQHDLSVAMGNVFNLPFTLRRSLGVATKSSYSSDDDAGTKGADFLMARLAAMPIASETLLALLGASDLEISSLKEQTKTAVDKLTWLCHRVALVHADNLDKYPRHHTMRTLVEDIFTAMADAQKSCDKWVTAPYAGLDAFNQLTRALCPSSSYKYQEGGLEDWTKWRYNEAKSFWPDWFDMPESYIDKLAAPEKWDELVELSIDAILLSISHPLGRSFARTGGDGWLDSHAKVLGRIMDERTRVNFLSSRQTCANEQARAAAVRDTVPRFRPEQLTKFLKACMEEKRQAFEAAAATEKRIAEKQKSSLQRACLRRNLHFVDSNGSSALAKKLMKHVEGQCTEKKDFLDKRGVISPRVIFPIPNHIFDRRGGKTENSLEELTLTYNYLTNCRDAWIQGFRRLRLYEFLRFVRYSRNEGWVDKNCDACLRRRVCSGDVPGFLVLACGHWLCERHAGKIDEKAKKGFCPAVGCGAPCGLSYPATIRLTETDVLACPDVWNAEGKAQCSLGGKAPEIVSLIKDVPEDDHVIFFTFIEELAITVREKLEQEGISVLSMVAADPNINPADTIQDFKEGKAKVIIIDPTAEHAAGSNLTIANHVIFASPVLERDQFLQRMYYRQAVGRCHREGQKKTVYVSTFVTKGTVDDELYEAQVYGGDV